MCDLSNLDCFTPFCKENDYYKIFLQIICSLLLNQEITLLDGDFTDQEVEQLTKKKDIETRTQDIQLPSMEFLDKNSFLEYVFSNHSKWGISIYTSGTTGLPKKVTHSFESLTRFVKINEQNNKSVWGFAYNATHMAGLQVFFQALLNGNEIVRLFGLNKEDIFNQIEEHQISRISATPTFYRMLLPTTSTFKSIIRLTSGGEKFDQRASELLNKVFPNAKITNVYASTEIGSLFASQGDVFSLKKELADKIKFIENELFVHKSLLGKLSGQNEEQWYATGDLIEIVSKEPLKFKFLSRKNEMINVGGYKVNPHEVEEAIRTYNGILDVRVSGKKNSVLGNIVVCEVVIQKQINEMELRTYLRTRLQEFKIPRIIKFVENISSTHTGKTKRR